MIDCHSFVKTVKELEFELIDIGILSMTCFFLIWYLQLSLSRAIVKTAIISLMYAVLYTSCYHVGYLQAFALCVVVGLYLENIYILVKNFIEEKAVILCNLILEKIDPTNTTHNKDNKDKGDKNDTNHHKTKQD